MQSMEMWVSPSKTQKIKTYELCQPVVPHTFNSSTREAEAGGYQWVWGQPDLQSEFQDSHGTQRDLVSENKTNTKELSIRRHHLFSHFWNLLMWGLGRETQCPSRYEGRSKSLTRVLWEGKGLLNSSVWFWLYWLGEKFWGEGWCSWRFLLKKDQGPLNSPTRLGQLLWFSELRRSESLKEIKTHSLKGNNGKCFENSASG